VPFKRILTLTTCAADQPLRERDGVFLEGGQEPCSE
jgi:hypothetical protein